MRIFRISRAERDTSPVFIVGEARSGTTILYRTLQKHRAFRPQKVNLWESQIMSRLDDISTLRPGEPRTMVGYMADDHECYRSFLDAIEPLRPLLRIGELGVRRLRGHRGVGRIWSATGFPLVIRAYFHYARIARGVERVLEKTPKHVQHVHRLLKAYPRAKLIYIHRHPVDVYSSYLRRAQVDPKTQTWTDISVRTFAERWKRNSQLALRAASRYSGSFLLLRYEDFTADPEASMRRVCGFVGEPYDPEIIIEKKPDPTRRKASPHLFGAITTRTKEWSDYLTIEDADLLQEKLSPIMSRLSYEPYPTIHTGERRPPRTDDLHA